jgi:hypothetical protein
MFRRMSCTTESSKNAALVSFAAGGSAGFCARTSAGAAIKVPTRIDVCRCNRDI